jgi:RpiR family carbohydrate utilization transcriptional regulator
MCISQSGRSKDLLITANLVRESGANLITLCPSQTPLAELSTVNLAIDVHEDTEIYTPLTSRIAHLVVIDVLAMGVAMARGPSLVNHLKSVKRSLRSLRLSPKSIKATTTGSTWRGLCGTRPLLQACTIVWEPACRRKPDSL